MCDPYRHYVNLARLAAAEAHYVNLARLAEAEVRQGAEEAEMARVEAAKAAHPAGGDR